jgi:hypothetical protein
MIWPGLIGWFWREIREGTGLGLGDSQLLDALFVFSFVAFGCLWFIGCPGDKEVSKHFN